jgi:hypothetical protein
MGKSNVRGVGAGEITNPAELFFNGSDDESLRPVVRPSQSEEGTRSAVERARMFAEATRSNCAEPGEAATSGPVPLPETTDREPPDEADGHNHRRT